MSGSTLSVNLQINGREEIPVQLSVEVPISGYTPEERQQCIRDIVTTAADSLYSSLRAQIDVVYEKSA